MRSWRIVCLLLAFLFLPVRVGASTNLSFAQYLIQNDLTDENDGLYVNPYVNEKYAYRGGNPDNFIELGGKLWRIINIDQDEKMRLVFESDYGENVSGEIGIKPFDLGGINDYEATTLNGEEDSDMKQYLEQWYADQLLGEKDAEYLQHFPVCIGEVAWFLNGQSLTSDFVNDECAIKTNNEEMISLIYGSEFLIASLNNDCIGAYDKGYVEVCGQQNYLDTDYYWWSQTPITSYKNYIWAPYPHRGMLNEPVNNSTEFAIRPVVTLSAEVEKLSGTGTKDDPYVVKELSDNEEEPDGEVEHEKETKPRKKAKTSSRLITEPGCDMRRPASTPDLFQIDRFQDRAIIYFTLVNDEVTDYLIVYGEEDHRVNHAVTVAAENNIGVKQWTIYDLLPSQKYHFAVAAKNGCAVGNWSNNMKVSGKTSVNGLKYYRYN